MKKSERTQVHEKYDGHCAYCGKEITIAEMQVDHIKPKRNGGADALNNYNPSCRRCNHYKRGGDIEYLRDMLLTAHERLEKDYLFKVALDYGIVKINKFDGKFYFEAVKQVL